MNIQNCDGTQNFLLNDVRVEPARNSITLHGEEARVEPRLMAVLVRLAAADGGVVSREALIDDVWGNGDPNDEALTQTVSRLRKAIGDDTKQPRIIETVPKRGYRLMVAPTILETRNPTETAAKSEQITNPPFAANLQKYKPTFTHVRLLWAAVIVIGSVALFATFNKSEKELYEVELLMEP